MNRIITGKSMRLLAALLVTALVAQMWWRVPESHLKEGDIVFRGTRTELAALTFSKWTHCGVLHHEKDGWVVYEANHGVERTPLSEWRHGSCIFKVMRTRKNLTPEQQSAIQRRIREMIGKRYDRSYMWSDEKIYCSELVWKAYHSAGIELSEPRKVDSFLLFKILPERDRNRIIKRKGLSMNDPMVPPADIIHSHLLRRVL